MNSQHLLGVEASDDEVGYAYETTALSSSFDDPFKYQSFLLIHMHHHHVCERRNHLKSFHLSILVFFCFLTLYYRPLPNGTECQFAKSADPVRSYMET